MRNALHHFLGTEVNDYHERCLRTFMLGAVKRVFQPGCKFELMLVLVGGQGAGKSTFLRTLAMEPDWFSDDLRNLSDKDVFHRLNGRWIIEMSEMVATANARSIEEIKAFLSRERGLLPSGLRPLRRGPSPAVRVRGHHQPHGLLAHGSQRKPTFPPRAGGRQQGRLPHPG